MVTILVEAARIELSLRLKFHKALCGDGFWLPSCLCALSPIIVTGTIGICTAATPMSISVGSAKNRFF